MSSNPADEVAARKRREREENPVQIDKVDGNVLAGKLHLASRDGLVIIPKSPSISLRSLSTLKHVALPDGLQIIAVIPSGASAWCETFRIDTKLADDTEKHFFIKVYTFCGLKTFTG